MPEVSKKITGEVEIPSDVFERIKKEIHNIPELGQKVKEFSAKRITEVLEVILGGAIVLEASDIHVEPTEENARLRSRIDGILQDVTTFDLSVYQRVLSRIKLLSGLKLNITDRPQDGRFSILFGQDLIEIRASSLPAEHGESIVLRILNPKSLIGMEALGLREDLLKIFTAEIKRPNGMIIVTGPTGSGKTTTLYAFLNEIQKPEIKIITIEDPIEYHLEGISQTQVNPGKGYDFANGLRSIMRQDPDVILVGEIRDLETAKIALQAALTGHLVLTTLHTNDAAGTVARLISLGAKANNIGPALNVAIAQRLLRRVCKECLKIKEATPKELGMIKKILNKLPTSVKVPKITDELKTPQAVGCKSCNSTGYRGRVGIFEAFFIDDKMEKFILTKPSIAGLRERAIERGMITMKQDGLLKVLQGITTLEELERVTGE
jgi:type II secretory ATPase GspE/PulE/Tfp pilus assembly ATPase PilB-like protein